MDSFALDCLSRGPFCRGPFGHKRFGRGHFVLDYLSWKRLFYMKREGEELFTLTIYKRRAIIGLFLPQMEFTNCHTSKAKRLKTEMVTRL
ncbi:hypothetical protein M514_07203 [Trichuris suis]|uniref:Uncharacterized protein n=1 Tax=Trichuris suis TaxID=68888 RepID=A0A085NC20_9BILA|nr:hypothetical protein M513_07203 [Trichuris suis]KFD67016.1 hypothetical protein M514_07203 [Trichuris suis]